MNKIIILIIVIPTLIFSQFTVVKEKQNILSSSLIGKWVIDNSLTESLRGNSDVKIKRIEFTHEKAIVNSLPKKYKSFLKNKKIYLAGKMKTLGYSFPYILIVYKGNPHLVFFRPRGGDPLGDAESFNLFIAQGIKKTNDILFIGGDHNGEAFTAYNREK